MALGAVLATAVIGAGALLFSYFRQREPEGAAPTSVPPPTVAAAAAAPAPPVGALSSVTTTTTSVAVANECCICMAEAANCLFLPCRHLKTCMACAPKVEKCPVCRAGIRAREGPVYA
jgi:hypothetical protein